MPRRQYERSWAHASLLVSGPLISQGYGPRSELSFHEFQQYFEGVAKGTALTSHKHSAGRSLSKTSGRKRRSPQSFAYVDTKTGNQLIRMCLAQDSTTKSTLAHWLLPLNLKNVNFERSRGDIVQKWHRLHCAGRPGCARSSSMMSPPIQVDTGEAQGEPHPP